MFYVEIGCAPGNPRPNIYLNLLITKLLDSEINKDIKDLVNNWINKEPSVKSFGDWEWNFEDTLCTENKELLNKNILNILQSFYDSGYIRYASSNFE